MDAIEVAARFTEAIMAKPGAVRKGVDPAESYVDIFAKVLKQVDLIINPKPAVQAVSRVPPSPQATSDIFPLTHERNE